MTISPIWVVIGLYGAYVAWSASRNIKLPSVPSVVNIDADLDGGEAAELKALSYLLKHRPEWLAPEWQNIAPKN